MPRKAKDAHATRNPFVTREFRFFPHDRKWSPNEDFVVAIFLCTRNLIGEVRISPSQSKDVVPTLTTVLRNLLPNSIYQRNLEECQVHLDFLHNQPPRGFTEQCERFADLLRDHPAVQSILDRFRGAVRRNQITMEEVCCEWEKLVEIGFGRLLELEQYYFSKEVGLEDHDAHEWGRRFVLENLLLSSLHDRNCGDAAFRTTLASYAEKQWMEAAASLCNRGIITISKRPPSVSSDSVIRTLFDVSIELSTPYREMLENPSKSAMSGFLRACRRVTSVEDESTDFENPYWFQEMIDWYCQTHEIKSSSIDITYRPTHGQKTSSLSEYIGIPSCKVKRLAEPVRKLMKETRAKVAERAAAWVVEMESGGGVASSEEHKAQQTALVVAIGAGSATSVEMLSEKVYNFVYAAGFPGTTKEALWSALGDDSDGGLRNLSVALNLLLKLWMVLPVGVTEVRYVTYFFAHPFLHGMSKSNGHFLPFPWLTNSGRIMKPVLCQYLRSVLHCIWERKRENAENVIAQFQPFLPGRLTLEILKILFDMEFVDKMRLVTSECVPALQVIDSEVSFLDDGNMMEIYFGCDGTRRWEQISGIYFLEELWL